jgi:hypothetical protein
VQYSKIVEITTKQQIPTSVVQHRTVK